VRVIGIDLGTTNTVAAIDGTTIQHASGTETSPIVPSVVAFPPSGATLAGATAKKRRAIDPKNTIYSAKRLIGQRWLSYASTQFRKQYPFDMVETSKGGCAFKTRAGVFTPVDIASKLIDKLFAARITLRSSSRAVVAVPAAFELSARDATRKAVEQAGIAQVTIVEEPVATAMAYLTARSERTRYAAVYDLGGGTFDLAIVDCTGQAARVIRHAGDAYLGGDDVDRVLADWVVDQTLQRYGWDLRADAEVFDRLVLQCELAKIQLAGASSASIDLAQVDSAAPIAAAPVAIDRQKLTELAQPLVSRTFLLCDQVLREAGLQAGQIDAVYLAGGTTLMPIVRDGVAHYFGSLPRCDFDPLEVVAIGASLMPNG
jgi:molecular chaperone DnaK